MPKIILCKSYANHIYDYDYITSIFFFLSWFYTGKIDTFTAHVCAERTL